MRNKKGALPLIAILVLIGAVLVISGAVNLKNITGTISGTGSYIERPVFKYLKCEPGSELKTSLWYNLPASGAWAVKPSSTSQYKVIFKVPKSALKGQMLTSEVCTSRVISDAGCRDVQPVSSEVTEGGRKYIYISISGVKGSEYVWLQYKESIFSWKGAEGGQYQIEFIPYQLREYNVLGGSALPVNPNDCTVPADYNSVKDYLVSSDSQKVNAVADGSRVVDERTFQVNEVRWYVSGYVTSAAPSFALTYKNQAAWCRPTGMSGEIYKINTLQVGSGTYKIASADYSDLLGSVTCCPGDKRGDATCSKDYKWISTAKAECSSFNPCGGAEWTPSASKRLVRYSCVSGKCTAQYKDVGCANDADCRATNQVCDLNSYQCVSANVNLQGQELKVLADNQADCEKGGGKWVKKTSEQKSIWNWIGIGEPKVIVEEYCQYGSAWDWLWTGAGVIVLIILVFLFIKFGIPYAKAIFATIRGVIHL